MGKKIKRLLCFGDSFCADSRLYHINNKNYQGWSNKHWGTNQSWIDELCGKLDITVEHLGEPGTGPGDVFWQISNFLAEDTFNIDDLVIITWSQYVRSRDSSNKPLRGFDEYDSVTEADMHIAAKLFFHRIYNDYERFNAYNMSINAVDNLMKDHSCSLFHFYCFTTEFMRVIPEMVQPYVKQTYTPQVGHVCEDFNLSTMCAEYYKGDQPDHTWWRRSVGDEHPNHLGPLANERLINYIMDRL